MAVAVAPPPRHGGPRPLPGRPPAGAVAATTAGPGEPVARLLVFTALAVFAAHAWGRLVGPGPRDHLTACALLAGATASAATLAAHLRIGDRTRRLLLTGAAVTVAALVLVACGMPARLLWVGHWGQLVRGLAHGIAALPGLRVPYLGDGPWVRVVVRGGGALLLLLSAALVAGRRGRPVAATAVLGVLYAVPVVETGAAHPFLDGGTFTVLALALAVGTRVPRAQAETAVGAIAVALVAAVVLAPALDGPRALVDIRHLSGGAGPPATSFRWDHTYTPLTWPRTGREMLRVGSTTAAYWKGLTLGTFDGYRWLNAPGGAPARPDTELSARHPGWRSRVTVSVRALRSQQLYAPGEILRVVRSSAAARPQPAGGAVTRGRPLAAGDAYVADVYAPRPTVRELRAAGTAYPSFVLPALVVRLPPRAGGRPRRGGRATALSVPPWGTAARPGRAGGRGGVGTAGARLLRSSGYGRTWALARRLRAAAASPYDLVRRVERRVRRGAVYDERPPAARLPLESFLFDVRRGYCQQFSGAMALLLRMAGVPARVAAGFAPGVRDATRAQFVVTDRDAHSWVEAYFPGIGWVTFDPTPASAPPASQADVADRGGAPGRRSPVAGRRSPTAPGVPRRGHARRGGDPGANPWPPAGGAALLIVLGALGVRRARRRSRRRRALDAAAGPELADLVRALALTGRAVPAGTTLAALERRFAASPGIRAYLAAVARVRYAGGDGPHADDRRALRRELAEGLGVAGHVRAWRALPPSRPVRAPRSPGRRVRRRSYT